LEWPEWYWSVRKEWRHSRQESGNGDRLREGLWLRKTYRLRKGLWWNKRSLKSSSFGNHRWYGRRVSKRWLLKPWVELRVRKARSRFIDTGS
jgi:hypothetical protein